MARPGQNTRGPLHVGRYLMILLLIVAALYSAVFFGGEDRPLTPKLGLDLQGGASVILESRTENGEPPTPDQLETAVQIISRRVNGAGVSEAEVVTQGENIVVSVPGGTRDSLRRVSQTAQLRFREVLQQLPGDPRVVLPTDPPAPSAVVVPPSRPPGASAGPASTGPAASGGAAPSASPASSTGPAQPGSPSPQSIGAELRARGVGPLVQVTPAPQPPASPQTTLSPRPSPRPSGGASTAPPPRAGGAAGIVRSGDVFTPQAFQALDCSNELARQGGIVDKADTQIVACSDDGAVKYQLDVAKVVGTDVAGATSGLDPQLGNEWQISVNFTGEGQSRWTRLTEQTVGKQVGIVLDGVVLSAPTIQDVISGDAQISGSFTQESSKELANTLKFGALPLTFEPQEEVTVSPTLGGDQLRAGLLAGGIGLAAVVVYSLLYYRALGVVTIASLLVSGLLTYASISILGKSIGFALSLAGIAGFIVAVGITADSFVVFFERLKDEIKQGRAPRSAVDRAWTRARRTILSADTVSFLAAIILYTVSVGNVRGFAFTLGLATLLDVIIVFLFTRPLVSFVSRYAWFTKSRWTGFFGPDGGEPLTGASARRTRPGSRAAEAPALATPSEA